MARPGQDGCRNGKGSPKRPFHEFGPVHEPGPFLNGPKEDEVQAEGCPVKTNTFPLPAAQTEISLDIGSPSFRYVEHDHKIGVGPRVCKARYITTFETI